MAANGISTQTLKRTRQNQKLQIAEAKRQGKTVTEGSGTFSISGSEDSTQPFYRSANTLDNTRLPTLYNASSNTGALVDNANSGGLQAGRPWTT